MILQLIKTLEENNLEINVAFKIQGPFLTKYLFENILPRVVFRQQKLSKSDGEGTP